MEGNEGFFIFYSYWLVISLYLSELSRYIKYKHTQYTVHKRQIEWSTQYRLLFL